MQCITQNQVVVFLSGEREHVAPVLTAYIKLVFRFCVTMLFRPSGAFKTAGNTSSGHHRNTAETKGCLWNDTPH